MDMNPDLITAGEKATRARAGFHAFKDMSPEMQDCIDNCTDCHQSCEQLIPHCLEMGGEHASLNHIRLLQDCAQICATSVSFMLRESDRHPLTCEVCAEICTACADDCERLAGGDEQMLECVEICRRCAESCSQMAKKIASTETEVASN